MAESEKSGGRTLTTIFIAATTAVLTGIPTDFISELIIFPFYHNSTLGGEMVAWSGSILLPYYEMLGEFFGFASQMDVAAAGVPTYDFG